MVLKMCKPPHSASEQCVTRKLIDISTIPSKVHSLAVLTKALCNFAFAFWSLAMTMVSSSNAREQSHMAPLGLYTFGGED